MTVRQASTSPANLAARTRKSPTASNRSVLARRAPRVAANTLIAQRFVNALESSVLSKIPAYEYLKQESASALGVAEIGELPVVFVPMEGGWQLGVQTEALSNGLVSIFVPGAPNPHSGSVFFFSTDIVRPAGIKLAAGLNCLRRCGAGASALGASWPSGNVRG